MRKVQRFGIRQSTGAGCGQQIKPQGKLDRKQTLKDPGNKLISPKKKKKKKKKNNKKKKNL